MKIITAIAALALPLAAMPVGAQVMNLQRMAAGDKQKVAELAAETNRACGTSIAFSVDYATYSKVLEDENNQSPWAYVANVTDALKSLCRSDDGKAAVSSNIRSVIVSNGTSERESLEGGVFRYTVPYAGHSPQTVKAWLSDNLQ